MSKDRNRQPPGVSTGGQYAPEVKAEPTAGLSRHPQTGRPIQFGISGGPYGEQTHMSLTPSDGPDIAHHLDAILADGSMASEDRDQQVFQAMELAGIEFPDDTAPNAWGTSEETEAELWNWVQANRDPEPSVEPEGMDDNPVWDPRDNTPHPTGGYTRIDDSAQARRRGATQIAYRNAAGQYHREDGPAIVMTFGDYEDCQWAQDGTVTRADGPSKSRVHVPTGAVISEMWTDENGRAHREDGPAISGSDGSREWFTHGQSVHRIVPADPLPEHLKVSIDGRLIQTAPPEL